jgi:hypothetical protein
MTRLPCRRRRRDHIGGQNPELINVGTLEEIEHGPLPPEWRPELIAPAPDTSWPEMIAEMIANDPEFAEWRQAEARAEWAAK